MYLCGPRKHNCQQFCGPEGRFDCSDECSLRPAPFSYLCVRVRILGVLKIVCCCTIKPDCRLRLLWSQFWLTPLPVSCPSTDHTIPLHIYILYIFSFCLLFCVSPCKPVVDLAAVWRDKRKDLGSTPLHSSGAVWESRWTSWAVRPNEPSGFRGRKDLLNRVSALVTTCP